MFIRYITIILIIALSGCDSDNRNISKRSEERVRTLFERRWEELRMDGRFDQITVREFLYLTKCEAVYTGSDWMRKVKTDIFPQEAEYWTLNSENQVSNTFKTTFSTSNTKIEISFSFNSPRDSSMQRQKESL